MRGEPLSSYPRDATREEGAVGEGANRGRGTRVLFLENTPRTPRVRGSHGAGRFCRRDIKKEYMIEGAPIESGNSIKKATPREGKKQTKKKLVRPELLSVNREGTQAYPSR